MQQIDFIKVVSAVLEEKGKTVQSLFDNNIISKDTFYKYKHRSPSLKTLIKVCNYLTVSIDYLFEFTTTNDFKEYNLNNKKFIVNLLNLINAKKISRRKFCDDLGYSHDNVMRWKSGTFPSLQTLLEISTYFNCTIDDLLL